MVLFITLFLYAHLDCAEFTAESTPVYLEEGELVVLVCSILTRLVWDQNPGS